jgi:hypothetical protein
VDQLSKSVGSKDIRSVAADVLAKQQSPDSVIAELRLEIREKDEEIKRLKEALEKAIMSNSNFMNPINDEEEIALIQIQKLKQLSRERALTLEEVKILDFLVKNKRLAQEQVTTIKGVKPVSPELGKKDLLKLVSPSKKEKKNESSNKG